MSKLSPKIKLPVMLLVVGLIVMVSLVWFSPLKPVSQSNRLKNIA